jgi:c-di-GMP-related signal transduction protein
MEAFIARQPILDLKGELYGYEILYRDSSGSNKFGAIDGDMASSNTIITAIFSVGIDKLTAGKKAFINFTRSLLNKEVATLLPNNIVVPEILENIDPDAEVIAACRALKKAGYTLALDDFLFNDGYEELVQIADIIKIDFLSTDYSYWKSIVKDHKRPGLRFLAEKIENREMYDQAVHLGYTLFQGYYFCKPVIISAKSIEPAKINQVELMRKMNDKEIDFSSISKIIERDISLSYELLKIVNSAAFYRQKRIESIKQALILLGEKELKKWIFLTTLRKVGNEQPAEIVTQSLVRARFFELFCSSCGMNSKKSEAFMMGLVSMLDVLLGKKLEDILNDISVSDDIKEGLLNSNGPLYNMHNFVSYYEKGMWKEINTIFSPIELKKAALCYTDAMKWVTALESSI